MLALGPPEGCKNLADKQASHEQTVRDDHDHSADGSHPPPIVTTSVLVLVLVITRAASVRRRGVGGFTVSRRRHATLPDAGAE